MSEKMCECKVCKQQIACSAKVCPHCGAKNKKSNPALAIVIGLVMLVAVIGLAGANDEPVKVGDVTQPGTSANVSNDDNSTQSGTSANTSKNENVFSVGEIAELRNVQAVLVGVTESAGSSFNTPAEGNVFLLCEFEITNNSNEEINISSMLSFKAYCDEYACNYSLGALLEKGNKNQLDGSIAAGKKFKGVIGYEVPADWKEMEIHFTPDILSDKEIIFVAPRN